MTSVWVAVLASVGSTVQFVLAMQQLAISERPAAEHQIAVGELLREVPRRHVRRRGQARRELRAIARSNPPELRAGICRLWLTLCGWTLLWVASLMALIDGLVS